MSRMEQEVAPRTTRRWLCVAHAFPPVSRSGTHRTLGYVRHLHDFGWKATVVTLDDADGPRDEKLLKRVPPETRVLRVRCPDPVNYIVVWVRSILAKLMGGGGVSGFGSVIGARHCSQSSGTRNSMERVDLNGIATVGGQGELRMIARAEARSSEENRCSQSSGTRDRRIESDGTRSRGTGGRSSGGVGTGHGARGGKHFAPIRWLRQLVSELLATPDSRVGWIPGAVRVGLRAIRVERPEVIYSTSPGPSAHLVALALRCWTGLPWIADFRDPWGANPYRPRRGPLARLLDYGLEWLVISRASALVCATPTMSDLLRRRFPSARRKVNTILNGFDAELFESVRPRRIGGNDEFVLAHAGQFYGPRSPFVWFAALRHAMNRDETLRTRLRLVLIGPEDYHGRPLKELAAAEGVADNVIVMGVVPHDEALGLLAVADAVALAGGGGPGADLQTPNKLFEYLALRRPIVAAMPKGNPAVGMLRDANAVAVVCEPEDANALGSAIAQLANGRVGRVANAWDGVGAFDRRHRADELAGLMDRVLGARQTIRASEGEVFVTREVSHSLRFTIGESGAPTSSTTVEATFV